METNELRRPLVEQLVRAHKNKAITRKQLDEKAAAHGWDKEGVDTLLPKEEPKDA
jgi:hypothetical protein